MASWVYESEYFNGTEITMYVYKGYNNNWPPALYRAYTAHGKAENVQTGEENAWHKTYDENYNGMDVI